MRKGLKYIYIFLFEKEISSGQLGADPGLNPIEQLT